MRYIDAESLEESVNNWLYNINTYYHPHSKRTTIPISEVFDLIKTEPTADVRENVMGKWIKHPEKKNIYGGKIVECSNCHTEYVVQYIEDELFCRNCGARMVEE